MRVSVDVVGAAVGCPPGVPDTHAARGQLFISQQLLQIAELAGLLGDVQRPIDHNCHAR
jgi:hypothetical protein